MVWVCCSGRLLERLGKMPQTPSRLRFAPGVFLFGEGAGEWACVHGQGRVTEISMPEDDSLSLSIKHTNTRDGRDSEKAWGSCER